MDETSPSVSVIVPVHNTEVYLAECLDSILTQRLADIEVLCVDDGSTDSSPEILRQYAAQDRRVRLIPQRPGGKGPGTARNTAIEAARGEYIAFVDSDDRIHPNMLIELYRAMVLHDADVAMCTISKFSDKAEDGSFASCSYHQLLPGELDKRPFSWRDVQHNLFKLRFASWNKLYRRTFLNDQNIRFSEDIFYEDLVFTFRALLCAERMRFVRKPLYHNRRQRDGATTYELGSRVFDAITAMRQLESFLKENPQYSLLLGQFEAFRFEKLYEYFHKNDRDHIGPFFEEMQRCANNPLLDDNPHLRESMLSKRELIQTKDVLGFLTYELWEARTKNASLTRKKRRLERELRRWAFVKWVASGVRRRVASAVSGERSTEDSENPPSASTNAAGQVT